MRGGWRSTSIFWQGERERTVSIFRRVCTLGFLQSCALKNSFKVTESSRIATLVPAPKDQQSTAASTAEDHQLPCYAVLKGPYLLSPMVLQVWDVYVKYTRLLACFLSGSNVPQTSHSRILPKDAMVVEWPFADHDHNCLGGTESWAVAWGCKFSFAAS